MPREWRGRKNVMQLHALRFWYGETLRGSFLYWRELTTRFKIGMLTAGETHRAQLTKKYFSPGGHRLDVQGGAAQVYPRHDRVGGNTKSYYFAKWKSILASLKGLGRDAEQMRRDRIRSMAYVKCAYHERIHRKELLSRRPPVPGRVLAGSFEGCAAGVEEIRTGRSCAASRQHCHQKLAAAQQVDRRG